MHFHIQTGPVSSTIRRRSGPEARGPRPPRSVVFVGAAAAGRALGLGAQRVQLVLVAKDAEPAEAQRHVLLQLLDLLVLELEDEVALHADQVIVVRAGGLVAR